ncbi:Calx-beta domain-containing protein [Gimesia maris]|uniref:Calx-beta domain-containing protein n=1 Tax=Gimesia maris TaxID=122 RepID=UPI0030D81158
MLLTHWLRSISSFLRPSHRPLHKRRVRSRYGKHAILNHQRRPVTVEELEDRTLLTSIISVADRGSVEGDTGLQTLVFTVTRTGVNAGDLNESVTIDFTTQDGSATSADNDYLATSGSFEFAASSTATRQEKTFQVKVQGDYRKEGDESFQILLSTQMSGVTIENDSVTLTIYDDEYRRFEETQLVSPPAPVSDGDHFGQIIEVDGDYMVVGVPDSDLVASDAGAVFLYERNRQGTADETDDTWSYSSTLTAFDGAADDHFGSSIAKSGDTIVIGAYGADLNQSDEGAAYVFRLSGGTWQLETKLTASNAEADDSFGTDVAIENDLIVIGAPLHNAPSYNNSGAAYIFTRSGSTWSEDQILTETEFYSSDNQLGTSVAIENGEIFVAARRAKVDDAGAGVGSVFSYHNNAGTWETQQQLTLTFTYSYDYAGSDLTVTGNHLAVIAADNSYVYLFELTEGNWESQHRVNPASSISSIRINSIDLSDNSLVVGSIKTNGSTNSSGIVTEYQWIRDQWIRTGDYYGESSTNTTGFGTGVALADLQIIVGEPDVDASALESGLIHVLGPFIPGYEIYDVTEYEGDSGQTLFEFTIERKASEAGDLNFASSISFTTIDGTATVANNDYAAQSGTLTFEADPDVISQFQTVTIVVNGDGTYEGDENFYLQLFNPTNGTQLFDTQGEAIIEADDKAVVELVESEISVDEGDGKVWLTLELDEVFSEDVTVVINYEAGSARAYTDFDAMTQYVTIPAGQLTHTFSVDIVEDAYPEDSEEFWVLLDGSYNANFKFGLTRKSVVTIVNDDIIDIWIDDIVVNENQQYATLYLHASQPVYIPLIFHFTTQDNTATSPDDYTGYADIFVRFASGDQTSQQLRIPIINDPEWESDESFFVNFTFAEAYNIDVLPIAFTDNQAEVTIIDDDQPDISIDDATINEDAGSVTLTVSLSNSASTPIQIDYSTADDTAVQTEDYSLISETLTFAPGEVTKTIIVPITDDFQAEDQEQFFVNLSNLQTSIPDSSIQKSKSVITILDNDQYYLTIDDQTVNEADGTATLTVTLDRALPALLTVEYSTLNQSATADNDYQETSGTLTIASGALTGTITVPINDDQTAEGLETFLINLINPQSTGGDVSLTKSQGQISITDNDQAGISIHDVVINEGVSYVLVTITLDQPAETEINVGYSTSGQTATSSVDFRSTSGTLTFAPGETSKQIAVSLINDNLVEADETFLVTLDLNNQQNSADVQLADSQGVVTIKETDQAHMYIQDVSVDESTSTAVVIVYLDYYMDTVFSVDYTTADLTAVSPDNYQATSGTLTFNLNQKQQAVYVPIIDNSLIDDDKSFLINLSNLVVSGNRNVTLSDNQSEVTILNDDFNGRFSIDDLSVDESVGMANITVSLSQPAETTVSVDFTTEGTTWAIAPDDYLNQSGTLTFNPGDQYKTISIPIVDDNLVERNVEIIRVDLSNIQASSGRYIFDNDQAEIYLNDNDHATLTVDHVTVNEGDGVATLVFSLDNPVDVTLSVNFQTESRSAQDSSDFHGRSGNILFHSGEQTVTLDVPIVDSDSIETDEYFFFKVSNFRTYFFSDSRSISLDGFGASVTILDDDQAHISISDLTVNEAAGTAEVTVSLDQPLDAPISLSYTTADQSAVSTEDFLSQSGTLTFDTGQQSKTISITLVNSDLTEADEKFLINLLNLESNGFNLVLTDTQAEVTIIDSDQAAISIENVAVNESAGIAEITVSLDKPVSTSVSVDYATSEQSALDVEDYESQSGTLTFSPGEQTKTITVNIVDSDRVELNETFRINLTNIQAETANVSLSDSQSVITILDDDFSSLSISDLTVQEDTGTAYVTVSLDGPLPTPVFIDFSTVGQTATQSVDYEQLTGTLTFAPGELTKSIPIVITDDEYTEMTETLLINLFNLQTASSDVILADSQSVLTIEYDDIAKVSVNNITVNESSGSAVIQVTLDHPVSSTITLDYTTADDSASNASDYFGKSGTLTFLAGQQTKYVSIPILNDNLVEGNESFLFNLTNLQANGYDVEFLSEQALITIQDNDQASISISDISVDEDAGTALLTVELSNPVETAFSVDFSTADDTALDQQDYTAQSGTFTFDAGQQSKAITIQVINSTLVEADEFFLVNLSDIQSGNYDVVFAADQAEVTIIDDDQAQVSINNITVDETAGTATLTVTLDHPAAESVSVDYQTANASATSPADFLHQSGTLTFAPSEVEKTVTISIIDSDLVETEESFLVNLSNLQAGTADVSLGDIQGVITILDDDQSNLRISDLTVQEDTGTAYVTVSLDKPLPTPVSIDFSTVGQTATQSADFEQLSGTLTFAPGELTKSIPIVITDDEYTEMTETLLINLFNLQTASSDVILADSQSVLTIEYDDIAKVSVNNITVNESSGSAVIQVTLDHPVSSTITLDYTTADDSASNASDYFGKSGTLTFLAGQQTKYVSIPILNDNLVEGNESFLFNLTNLQANGYDVDFLSEQALITIQDNDQASISISDISVDENAGTALLTVELSKPVGTAFTVNYATAEQSALGTLDFIATSGTLTFDSGEQSKTIAVSLVNTDLVESDETFLINLFDIQANGADITLANDQAVVRIQDDDQAQISIDDISVVESAETAVITVSLDAPVDTAISVDFSTSDQTANHPDDYLAVSGSLIFNPGDLSQTITVAIVNSDHFEINETFQIDLENIQTTARDVTIADDQAVITIQDKVTTAGEIHFRVVNQPTSTSLTGEADTLPENESIISEWSTYWVEIWVELTSQVEQGVYSVSADFKYNTAYTSAAEIEFGEGFTQNQAGSINDLTGSVTGIYAETTINHLGADSPVLFARVRFSPGSEDQVSLETEPNSIGPYNLNFEITNSHVELGGNTPVTVSVDLSPGASIYANPFDLNDDDIINYRDLILLAGLYNTVPSESDSKFAWFSDFNQDDRINYRDLISLVGNYNKGKQDQTEVIYPHTYPNAWSDLLLVDTLSTPPVTADSVSQSDVVSTFDTVIDQTMNSPVLSSEQQKSLKHIDIQVIDLGGDILGAAAGSTIYIDVDAAGYGWFIDSTPTGYSEYTWSSELTLIALPDSDAADGIDLWTVIQHELGHLLDYEHSETGLMQETLAPGIRKLPEWELNYEYENPMKPEAVDPFFFNMLDETNLLPF